MNGAPRTIACSSCGAPAVLSVVAERQTCSSCRAPLALPVEVRAELLAAARLLGSKLELARHLDVATGQVLLAERSTLLFALGLVLLLCGGLHGLNVLAVLHKGLDRPSALVPPAGGLATAFAVALATFAAHRLARRSLARTFAARAAGPGAPHGACHACGGPLPGARGGSVRCDFCGCENLLGATAVIRQASESRRGALCPR